MAESNGVQNIKETLLNTAVKLSNLKDKVNSQRKLSYSNLGNNIISDGIIEISPKDDFDVNGYQRTPEENWELFSSLKTVQVEAGGNNTAFIKSRRFILWCQEITHMDSYVAETIIIIQFRLKQLV